MVKIEGFERKKTLGKFSEEAVGASLSVFGEVTKAEYVKGEDGKPKLSSGGNKQIKINIKATKTEGDKTFSQFINVTYYEIESSPKLVEIAPKKVGDKEILKKVNVTFSNGGKVKTETEKGGFGDISVYNKLNDEGKNMSGISVFGGNVKLAKKFEGTENYFVEGFNGEKEEVGFGWGIPITLKGIIEPIVDTETFLIDNYNADKKTLTTNIFCFDVMKGVKSIPITFDNVDDSLCKAIVNKLKTSENTLVAISGEYASVGKPAKTSNKKATSEFGDYDYGGDFEYFATVKVGYDEEKGKHKIKFFDKKGKLTIDKSDVTNTTNTTTTKKKEEFDF